MGETLKTYRVTYTDGCYPPEVVGTITIRAYDRAHAIERFYEADDGGWGIKSVDLVRPAKDDPPHAKGAA